MGALEERDDLAQQRAHGATAEDFEEFRQCHDTIISSRSHLGLTELTQDLRLQKERAAEKAALRVVLARLCYPPAGTPAGSAPASALPAASFSRSARMS